MQCSERAKSESQPIVFEQTSLPKPPVFSSKGITHRGFEVSGLGLTNLRRRAEKLHGQFDVVSRASGLAPVPTATAGTPTERT